MPYTLKKNKFKYKNPDTGNYEGVDVVAERSFADYQSALETVGLQQQTVVRSEGTTQKNAVTAAGTAAAANFPATAAACDTLAGDFAATYVPDQAYAVGDYCTYQYQLYQCKTAIAVNTDHTFVTSHWNLITVTDTINDQVDDLKTQLITYNSANLLPRGIDKSQSGITWTWHDESCTVSGTHTGSSAATNFLIGAASSPVLLPYGIIPGKTYKVKYKTNNTRLKLRFTFYSGETSLGNTDFLGDGEITVPNNATGILVLLRLDIGSTINDTVYPCMLAAMSNAELEKTMEDSIAEQQGDLIKFNSYNAAKPTEWIDKTTKGITWTLNSDGSYTVSGTSTDTATNTIAGGSNDIPDGIRPGGTYVLKYDGDTVAFSVVQYQNGDQIKAEYFREDNSTFSIESDADGVTFRLFVSNSATVNETVHAYVLTSPTNLDLKKEINDITNNLEKLNSYNIINPTEWVDKTAHDVTYIKNADNSYTVSGTASATSSNNICGSKTSFPDGFDAGKSYTLQYDGSVVAFSVLQFDSNEEQISADYYRATTAKITISSNAVGVILRLFVANSATANETVHPIISNAYSNAELTEKVDQLIEQYAGDDSGFIVHTPDKENDIFVASIKEALDENVVSTTAWATRSGGIRNFNSDKIYSMWDYLQNEYSDYIDPAETIGYSFNPDGSNYKPIKAYYIHPRKTYGNTTIPYGTLQTVFITAGTHGVEGSPCWNLYTIFQRAFERGTIYSEFLHNRQFRIVPCLSRWSYDHFKRYLAAAYDDTGTQIVPDEDLPDYDANRQCICTDNTHPSYATLDIHSYAGEATALTNYMNNIGINANDVYIDLHNCSYSLGYLTTDIADIRYKFNAMVDTLAKDWIKYSPWKNGDIANYYETSTDNHAQLQGKICAHESIETSYAWFFEKAYTIASSNILEVQQYDENSCDSYAIAKGLDMTYRWLKALLD